MKIDELFEYLIPIILLILYFIVTMGKSRRCSSKEEEQKKIPTPPLLQDQLEIKPKTSHKHSKLRTQAENQRTGSDHNESLLHPFKMIASEGLDRLALDPSYAHRVKLRIPRVEKLFKKRSSLRKAMLLKEIIHRPYDF